MEKRSALQRMTKQQRYMVYDIFIAYFAMGIYLILVGSALPSIKAEYHISYRIGGLMMSAQQIGYLVTGLVVSVLARKWGPKRSYLTFGFLAFIGLALMMVNGNPFVLLFAMLLTGICKGSTANFGNQIVSVYSGNDAALLNLAQAFFAVGACAAPLIALACGTSWRAAFAIAIAVGVLMLLHGTRVTIEPRVFESEQGGGKLDFGFLRTKIFWLCAMILMCYLAVEASVMGWLVTFFVDSGVREAAAQLLATSLWVALLIGRFACAWLSTRFQPQHMVAVMTVGVTICFTGMMCSHTLIPMAVSTMGLGLFMAGMYGTMLGGSEGIIERYPICMGMLIAIPGIGAAVTPGVVGMLADIFGIRGGMMFLYVLIAILIVTTLLLLRYKKHSK